MNSLRKLRIQKGLNMRQTAAALCIPYTTYVNYEKGEREPNSEMLMRLADFFGVSVDRVIGRYAEPNDACPHPDLFPLPNMKKIPLVGTIACGAPVLAVENIEELVNIPENIAADFALRCRGDSMINARIFDGDLVYIHQQPDVENGEIAAVIIDEEATLKRVYKYHNRLELRPENPLFPVYNFEGAELKNIRIIGKAVAFTSVLR